MWCTAWRPRRIRVARTSCPTSIMSVARSPAPHSNPASTIHLLISTISVGTGIPPSAESPVTISAKSMSTRTRAISLNNRDRYRRPTYGCMSLSRMRAIERGSSTRAEPSTSRWSSARPAPPGNVSGNALSVFSAVTSVCHEPDHGEAGHEQHHEYYREQVEVAVNEPLDRRTEHPDEPGHQEESRAAAHERNQDELQQWNLERPAGYRKHLVRHRGESGSTERQHEVLPVELSHMFELVHHTVPFEHWT